ncbi:nucleotidyltransferase [Campylobacter armoricus]|uniref:GlnD domain-containing protein n=1 Tax=Campylobacter armoricus TaxID=2505970 RepID=A0A7L5I9B7_9BACT|nr:nucleotidyltransferase [Campylobacter armoricus]QKF79363.1 GlnD domain-containing protein [Campylobacter armoricus]
MNMQKIQKLKNSLKDYESYSSRLFLKQGSFSFYHSKEIDHFIEDIYELILNDFFDDFYPHNDKIPFCVIAIKQYAKMNLSIKENIDLLLIYKDIKAYNIKPLMKAFITSLNDINLSINYQICEINGLYNIAKNELKQNILQNRYICGSKILFKQVKEKINQAQEEFKDDFALKILQNFNPFYQPLIYQEFNINKNFGGLDEQLELENLNILFKDSPKNYMLSFIDEKELSEFKLSSDFLFSLKCAMNLLENKNTDLFLIQNSQELANLMQRKEKKNLDLKSILTQKAMQCIQTCGFYTHFLARCIQEKHYKEQVVFQNTENNFIYSKNEKDLKIILNDLLNLKDQDYNFDIRLVFTLKRVKNNNENLELFRNILKRKHSYSILKLLSDANVLKDFCKPLIQSKFLLEEEGCYSALDRALLCLRYFEEGEHNFDENMTLILKLTILLSAIREENEISLANIYRAYVGKFQININLQDLGLRLLKNFNTFKDIIEKEDIYNSTIVLNFISKLNDIKTLKILHILSFYNAKALNITNHFYYKSLERLFQNALEGFEDENLIDEGQRRVKKEQTLKRSKAFLELDEQTQNNIIHIKSNLFFIKNSFEKIIKIIQIAQKENFIFWLDNQDNFTLELIMNRKNNLENILNTLSSLNLVFMSFFELFEEKVYLKFEYSDIVSDNQKQSLENLLNSKLHLKVQKKAKKPNIKKDELKLDMNYSKNYAKITLNTKDQKGLMAYVMDVLVRYDIILSAAKIQTIKERTRNVLILHKNKSLQDHKDQILKSLISE